MSPEETTPAETARSEHAPPPKQGSLFRIILILLLVLAVIALIIDRRAQSAAQELHTSIQTLLDSAPALERPTIEAVHEKAAREPSTTYEQDKTPNMKVEEYRFRGGLPWRNYTVYVYYRTAPQERLYSVSLNQPEEF
jgi:hypothetical protein